MCCQSEEYVVKITANDGSHGSWGRRTGLGHRTAALAYKDHRLLCGENAYARRGSHLSDGMTRNDADMWVGIGRVREELEGGEQAGSDEKRLRNGGISDRFRVCLSAVVPQIEAGYRGEPVQPVSESGNFEPRA